MSKGVRRKALLLALTTVVCLLCSGCLGAHSLDEYGYVLMIGVDKGEEAPFYVTLLLQKGGQGGETDAAAEGSVLAGTPCTNLFDAIDQIEASMPFRLELSRAAVIVCAEELAKSGAAAEEFLAISLGSLRVRYYVNLVVAQGQARDYLAGLRSTLAPNLAKLQDSFVQYSEATGLAPVTTLAQFYEGAWSPTFDTVLPLGSFNSQRMLQDQLQKLEEENMPLSQYQQQEADGSDTPVGGMKSSLEGAAVFDGSHMVGTLTGEQTQYLLMALGEFQRGRIQMQDREGRQMSVVLQKADRPTTTIRFQEGVPKGQIALSLHAAVERPASVAEISPEEMEQEIAQHIQKGLEQTFLVCQDMGSDAFGLGKAAVSHFDTVKDWEAFNWKRAYQMAQVEFHVVVSLQYNPTKSRME